MTKNFLKKKLTMKKEGTKASHYLNNYRIEKCSDNHLEPFLLFPSPPDREFSSLAF